MGADKLYEGYLSTKIEGDDQAVVSSRDFEPDALAVEDLGFRGGSLNLVCRGPMRRSDELEPTFERDLRFRVLAPKVDKRISGNDPHGTSLARSQYGNKHFDGISEGPAVGAEYFRRSYVTEQGIMRRGTISAGMRK
jgi:hypothetical protein